MTTPPERRRVPSFNTLRKSRGERRASMSGSETLPALESTRLEGGTTGSSLHAMPEAVTALPTPNLWLVSPFHGQQSSKGEATTGYEVCRSYVKASGSWPRPGAVVARPSGPRRIRMGREKNRCGFHRPKSPKTAWQSMEKPDATWGFPVERCGASHPHR
jgi:hypothetical protein